MNILICAVQFKGGSLQVVISLIKEFVHFPTNNYHIVVSKEVKKQLTGIDFPSNFYFYDLDYPTGNRLLNSFLRGKQLSKIEAQSDADCTICTSGPLYWTPKSPLLIGYNLPHLVYQESPYFKRIPLWMRLRWRLKWFVHKARYHREASAIFVQTDDVNMRLREILRVDTIYTVSNTYNNAYNLQKEFPNRLPERKGGEYRLLMLSAFYKHKNFEIIPKVVQELARMGEKNVHFVVTLPKEKYQEVFASTAYPNILNVGFVPTLEGPSLYKECDAMFLPTLLECFSASYAEAMVMRKPILTSDLGFAHTVCKDAAIYFDPDDPKAIANSIIQLKNDKLLQEHLIRKGEAQLSQFGTAEDRASRILNMCYQLAKK